MIGKKVEYQHIEEINDYLSNKKPRPIGVIVDKIIGFKVFQDNTKLAIEFYLIEKANKVLILIEPKNIFKILN